VAGAEIDGVDVAFDVIEAVGDAVLGRDAFGDRNHAGPIDGGDAHLRRGLRQGDPPDAGAGGNVENFHRLVRSRQVQMLRELLRQIDADERVEEHPHTAGGAVYLLRYLLDRVRTAVNGVEDFVSNRRLDDQRDRVTPCELPDALGGDGFVLCRLLHNETPC